MGEINILLTGGGSPGVMGSIHSLRNNYDNRRVNIVCTDAKDDCVGKFLADSFYQIPRADNDLDYLEKMLEICVQEKIHIILPQNTIELVLLSENSEKFESIGVKIIVTESKTISLANNKYELLKICKNNNIPYPEFYYIDNKKDLIASGEKLGWPKKPFVVKLPDSNGSRGIRVIDEQKDYGQMFFNEKPTNLFSSLENFLNIMNDSFTPLLVMEYLPGEEVSIDLFRDDLNFISIPRRRTEVRSGISFSNEAFKDKELMKYSQVLSEKLNLFYCFGFQFKYDCNNIPKILECNPRVQGTMIFSTIMGANLIYSAVKSSLGEELPEFTLDWDAKLYRYWGAIGITNNKTIKI